MITVASPGRKLTESDVASLEQEVGCSLPGPYRQFLLDYNGGTPDPDCVDVPGFGETDVQVFYGIERDIETSCIPWNIQTLSERLDPLLLPIACDSGDNVFCLSLRADDMGAVIYCDLDAVFGDYGKAPPMYPAALDFSQFLRGFRPLD